MSGAFMMLTGVLNESEFTSSTIEWQSSKVFEHMSRLKQILLVGCCSLICPPPLFFLLLCQLDWDSTVVLMTVWQIKRGCGFVLNVYMVLWWGKFHCNQYIVLFLKCVSIEFLIFVVYDESLAIFIICRSFIYI